MHSEPETWFGARRPARRDRTRLACAARSRPGRARSSSSTAGLGGCRRADYERFALPATRRILGGLAPFRVPRILFGVGTGELLDLMATAGADVVGVDWRVPLDRAAVRVGPHTALQGNLDPAICLAGFDAAGVAARRVLDEGRAAPGHVFNLGHGVLPGTDPAVLQRLVELVHATSPRRGAMGR